MPKYEIEYSGLRGSVIIEAESEDEAEALFYDDIDEYLGGDFITVDWIGEVEE